MPADTIALFVALLLLGLATLPLWIAKRRNTLYATDLAIVVVTTAVFVFSAYYLNPAVQIGWALILYPFLALAASVVMLYCRVFVLDGAWPSARVASVAFFFGTCAVAFYAGVSIPPLYE